LELEGYGHGRRISEKEIGGWEAGQIGEIDLVWDQKNVVL